MLKFSKLAITYLVSIVHMYKYLVYKIFFNTISNKPNYEALKQHCNLWRNWYDIDDSWSSLYEIFKYFAENQDRIQPHGGPGHWNDPDMVNFFF